MLQRDAASLRISRVARRLCSINEIFLSFFAWPYLTDAACLDFFQVVDHPTEGKVRSMRVSSQWSRSQPKPVRQAPQLGEHTIEILKEAALSHSEIETLLERKTVRSSKPNSTPEV
jgi:hypothetical protein